MIEEKMLIEQKKINVFQKIKNFITKIFRKNRYEEVKIKEEPIIDEIKVIKEIKDTLILQQEYENGEITKENLNEEEKEQLIKLYKEQIESLENEIAMNKQKLEYYKKEIISKRDYIISKGAKKWQKI